MPEALLLVPYRMARLDERGVLERGRRHRRQSAANRQSAMNSPFLVPDTGIGGRRSIAPFGLFSKEAEFSRQLGRSKLWARLRATLSRLRARSVVQYRSLHSELSTSPSIGPPRREIVPAGHIAMSSSWRGRVSVLSRRPAADRGWLGCGHDAFVARPSVVFGSPSATRSRKFFNM